MDLAREGSRSPSHLHPLLVMSYHLQHDAGGARLFSLPPSPSPGSCMDKPGSKLG